MFSQYRHPPQPPNNDRGRGDRGGAGFAGGAYQPQFSAGYGGGYDQGAAGGGYDYSGYYGQQQGYGQYGVAA